VKSAVNLNVGVAVCPRLSPMKLSSWSSRDLPRSPSSARSPLQNVNGNSPPASPRGVQWNWLHSMETQYTTNGSLASSSNTRSHPATPSTAGVVSQTPLAWDTPQSQPWEVMDLKTPTRDAPRPTAARHSAREASAPSKSSDGKAPALIPTVGADAIEVSRVVRVKSPVAAQLISSLDAAARSARRQTRSIRRANSVPTPTAMDALADSVQPHAYAAHHSARLSGGAMPVAPPCVQVMSADENDISQVVRFKSPVTAQLISSLDAAARSAYAELGSCGSKSSSSRRQSRSIRRAHSVPTPTSMDIFSDPVQPPPFALREPGASLSRVSEGYQPQGYQPPRPLRGLGSEETVTARVLSTKASRDAQSLSEGSGGAELLQLRHDLDMMQKQIALLQFDMEQLRYQQSVRGCAAKSCCIIS